MFAPNVPDLPLQVLLGEGAVIKGLEKGLVSMRKGETAVLICRADYAYGAAGRPLVLPVGALRMRRAPHAAASMHVGQRARPLLRRRREARRACDAACGAAAVTARASGLEPHGGRAAEAARRRGGDGGRSRWSPDH